MAKEYDTLYSFLQELIEKNKTSTTLSAIIPDTITIKQKTRGRPPGSKNKEKIQCQACLQKFYSDKFKHHEETSVACRKFNQLEEKPVTINPIHEHIISILDRATHTNKNCNFCEELITDPKQHFTDSVVCNRMAYSVFKKLV